MARILCGLLLVTGAGCRGMPTHEREALDARAAESLWPLADGFWWEYDDTAAPSGTTQLRLAGRDATRDAWTLRGLWERDAYLIVEAQCLLLAVERRLGYAGAPGLVTAYEFRWDVGAWDIRSMEG
jgi:hypothetical protein